MAHPARCLGKWAFCLRVIVQTCRQPTSWPTWSTKVISSLLPLCCCAVLGCVAVVWLTKPISSCDKNANMPHITACSCCNSRLVYHFTKPTLSVTVLINWLLIVEIDQLKILMPLFVSVVMQVCVHRCYCMDAITVPVNLQNYSGSPKM